jgi:tetraacyldisaccharide 4'-kinase
MRLVHVGNGSARPVSDLAGKGVVAFCGIGNPDSFFKTLEGLGAKMDEEMRFSDHFEYRPSDMEAILAQARRHRTKWIVTTEKDAVKIRPLLPPDVDLWALRVEVIFWEDPEKWAALLFRRGNTLQSETASA